VPENKKEVTDPAPKRKVGHFKRCCIKKSIEGAPDQKRWQNHIGGKVLIISTAAWISPSPCLESGVLRLNQTTEQLNAIDGIAQIAPRILIRPHTSGYFCKVYSWKSNIALLVRLYVSFLAVSQIAPCKTRISVSWKVADTPQRKGNIAGRPWRDCHNSATPSCRRNVMAPVSACW